MTEMMIKIHICILSESELNAYSPEESFWLFRYLRPGMDEEESSSSAKVAVYLVVIRIEFANQSPDSIAFSFSNRTRKAECFGLEIYNAQGTRIIPERDLHIRPKPGALNPRILASHEKYTYDLVGELLDGWLVFPGAEFDLSQNSQVSIAFEYKGARSNVVHLQPMLVRMRNLQRIFLDQHDE